MHAMLALAASNLTSISGTDFSRAALSHRVHAVSGLKGALGPQIRSASEADATLAAFYIFGFQSLYIDDGLIDFLIMIRGCTLVTRQIQSDGLPTVFQFPNLDSYIKAIAAEEAHIPCMSSDLAISAIESLQTLKPLCKHETEILALSLLESIIMQMQFSTAQGLKSQLGSSKTLLQSKQQLSRF